MADVFKILFPVIGLMLSTISFWVFWQALLPNAVAEARTIYEQRPVRAVLVGAIITVPGVMIGVSLLGSGFPPFQFAGFAVMFGLLLAGFLGSAGLSQLLGERLHSPVDAAQPWRRTLRGGIVLAFVCLFPVLGWFLVLPVALGSGVGASALWVLRRRRVVQHVEPMEAMEA